MSLLEPSPEENILRIYLQLDNRSASDITTWVWGEGFDESMIGLFDHDRLKPTGEKDGFVYFDLKLKENFDPQAGFWFLFHDGQNQSEDFNYQIEDYGNTIYVQWNEKSLIRDNPFFLGSRLLNAQWIDQETIEVHLTNFQ